MCQVQGAVRSGQRDAGCEVEEIEFSPSHGLEKECLEDGSETCSIYKKILKKFPGQRFLSHPVLSLVLILLLLVLLAVTVALAVQSAPQVPVPCAPPPPVLGCPSDWVGYSGVCYSFSRDVGTWDQAQERCSELGASLAIVRDEELDLLFRLCGNVDFWLGLRSRDGRLQWGDGSSFSSSVPVLGNSPCVFLADGAFRSESCSTRRPYVCSKAAAPLGQGLEKGSSPLRAVPASAPSPA